MNIYLQLFLTFAQVGVLTFGGGLTMLPMLNRELVNKKKWVTEEELLDYYAVGQCTPGIIAVNTATFVGYKIKGIAGGIVATAGIVFPSVVIILAIASIIAGFSDNVYVMHALAGIRAVVCALLVNTVITMAKKSLVDLFCVILFIAVFVLSVIFDIPSILTVIVSAFLGIIFDRFKKKA